MATRVMLVTMAGYPMTPSCFFVDNGLAQLAACLVAEGHEVSIVDLTTPDLVDRLFPARLRSSARELVAARLEGTRTERVAAIAMRLEAELGEHRDRVYDELGAELGRRVARDRVDWVGFKLWNGDGFTGSVRMARALRAVAPEVKLLAGGPQVDFFQEVLPELDTPFDAFAVAEGEPTVVEFARWVEGTLPIDRVPNILFGRGDDRRRTELVRVRNLEDLPLPLYGPEVYPAASSGGKLLAGAHEETRGCPYECGFCNHPLKAGAGMRAKRPARVASELKELGARYGLRAFKLGGSYTPSGYMRRLATALIDQEVDVDLCAYGRLSDAHSADFALYRRAGIRALFFGVETGSQLLLDEKIDKRYDVSRCAAVLTGCREAGIFTITSLVYPNPGETEESRQATLRLMDQVQPDGAPIHFPILLPGSPWWRDPERFGFQVPDRAAYLRRAVAYKARLLFPPSFWPPLGYRIDQKPYAQFAAETEAMTRDLEARGILTLLSDGAAMVSFRSGLSPREFRDRFRFLAATGDAAGVQSLLDRVNDGLRNRADDPSPLSVAG